MQRRELIAGLVTTIAAAPVFGLRIASAQQAAKVRTIGVLMGTTPQSDFLLTPFMEELARLGWTDGRNVRFERRWTNADVNRASALQLSWSQRSPT
jgi:putative tryptophan/tyrosine transport system substrate-binding protein